jgi:hypothetical protein
MADQSYINETIKVDDLSTLVMYVDDSWKICTFRASTGEALMHVKLNIRNKTAWTITRLNFILRQKAVSSQEIITSLVLDAISV